MGVNYIDPVPVDNASDLLYGMSIDPAAARDDLAWQAVLLRASGNFRIRIPRVPKNTNHVPRPARLQRTGQVQQHTLGAIEPRAADQMKNPRRLFGRNTNGQRLCFRTGHPPQGSVAFLADGEPGN